MRKRATAFLLALALAAGPLSAFLPAAAAEGFDTGFGVTLPDSDGDGAYEISTIEQWRALVKVTRAAGNTLHQVRDKAFELNADLTYDWTDENVLGVFYGQLKGNGHMITVKAGDTVRTGTESGWAPTLLGLGGVADHAHPYTSGELKGISDLTVVIDGTLKGEATGSGSTMVYCGGVVGCGRSDNNSGVDFTRTAVMGGGLEVTAKGKTVAIGGLAGSSYQTENCYSGLPVKAEILEVSGQRAAATVCGLTGDGMQVKSCHVEGSVEATADGGSSGADLKVYAVSTNAYPSAREASVANLRVLKGTVGGTSDTVKAAVDAVNGSSSSFGVNRTAYPTKACLEGTAAIGPGGTTASKVSYYDADGNPFTDPDDERGRDWEALLGNTISSELSDSIFQLAGGVPGLIWMTIPPPAVTVDRAGLTARIERKDGYADGVLHYSAGFGVRKRPASVTGMKVEADSAPIVTELVGISLQGVEGIMSPNNASIATGTHQLQAVVKGFNLPGDLAGRLKWDVTSSGSGITIGEATGELSIPDNGTYNIPGSVTVTVPGDYTPYGAAFTSTVSFHTEKAQTSSAAVFSQRSAASAGEAQAAEAAENTLYQAAISVEAASFPAETGGEVIVDAALRGEKLSPGGIATGLTAELQGEKLAAAREGEQAAGGDALLTERYRVTVPARDAGGTLTLAYKAAGKPLVLEAPLAYSGGAAARVTAEARSAESPAAAPAYDGGTLVSGALADGAVELTATPGSAFAGLTMKWRVSPGGFSIANTVVDASGVSTARLEGLTPEAVEAALAGGGDRSLYVSAGSVSDAGEFNRTLQIPVTIAGEGDAAAVSAPAVSSSTNTASSGGTGAALRLSSAALAAGGDEIALTAEATAGGTMENLQMTASGLPAGVSLAREGDGWKLAGLSALTEATTLSVAASALVDGAQARATLEIPLDAAAGGEGRLSLAGARLSYPEGELAPAVTSLELTAPSAELSAGGRMQLTARAGGVLLDDAALSGLLAQSPLAWTVSPATATVERGMLTLPQDAAGVYTVTASYAAPDGPVEDSFAVTALPAQNALLAAAAVGESLFVADTRQGYKATFYFENGGEDPPAGGSLTCYYEVRNYTSGAQSDETPVDLNNLTTRLTYDQTKGARCLAAGDYLAVAAAFTDGSGDPSNTLLFQVPATTALPADPVAPIGKLARTNAAIPENTRWQSTDYTREGALNFWESEADGVLTVDLNRLRAHDEWEKDKNRPEGERKFPAGTTEEQVKSMTGAEIDSHLGGAESTAPIEAKAWVVLPYRESDAGSGGDAGAEKAPARPVIDPNGPGASFNGTVTITAAAGASVFYRLTAGASPAEPQFDTTGPQNADPGAIFRTYQYEGPFELPDVQGADSVTVSAVAWFPGRPLTEKSQMSYMTYTKEGSVADANIRMYVKADAQADLSPFISTSYYDPDLLKGGFFLDHLNADGDSDLGAGSGQYQIYYTVNGPNPSSDIQKVPQTKTYSDTSRPLDLSTYNVSNTVVVRAIAKSKNGAESTVALFNITLQSVYKAPLALDYDRWLEGERQEVASGSQVKNGQRLMLLLDEGDLPEGMAPQSYGWTPKINPDGWGYTRVELQGKTEERVHLDDDHPEYMVPRIEYQQGAGTIPEGTAWSTYRQYVPKLFYARSFGAQTSYRLVEPQQPQPITLSGKVGDAVTLAVRVPNTNPTFPEHKANETVTLRYTIRQNVADPTASPPGTAENPGTVQVGETVTLTSDSTVATEIYYTLDGTTPRPAEARADLPGETEESRKGTFRYNDTPIQVVRKPSMSLTVKAMARSVNDEQGDSGVVSFFYRIRDLDPAQAPAATPATSDANPTALRRGATVMLTTPTLDSQIYYTLNGRTPDPQSLASTGNPDGYTYLYDPGGRGVPMQPQEGSELFNITAMTTAVNCSDSQAVRFTYRLDTLDPPIVQPATSDEKVATLAPGDRITLSVPVPNTKIYYTDDGTAPVVPAAGGVPAAPTKLYDAAAGILMPESVPTFYTILAVAHDPSGAYGDSATARFSYQLPAAVQPVYASPGAGDVIKGTQVTLQTSTADAKIFYTLSYDGDPPDPVAYQSQAYSGPIPVDDDLAIKAVAEKDGMVSAVTTYAFDLASQVREPRPSIEGGSVVARGAKLHLSAPSAATVIYTKDGSDPSAEEKKDSGTTTGGGGTTTIIQTGDSKKDENVRYYGNDVVLDGEEGKSMTICAYATQAQKTPSEVVTLTYTICRQEEVITASPPSGSTVARGTQVSLSTPITDADIYWTTDGSTPGYGSGEGGTVTLDGEPGSTVTLKALATTGDDGAVPVILTYTMMPKTAAPTASIPSGAITLDGAAVTLTAKEGSIFYTTDGAAPTTSSALYTGPIEVKESMVLKAVAVADGMEPSDVVQYAYTKAGQAAAPLADPPDGEIESGTPATLASDTPGAAIYYSTNGMEPSPEVLDELFAYTGPIQVTRAVTIKAIAIADGLNPSAVGRVTYTVKDQPPPPPPEEPKEAPKVTTTDRLESRRTYSAKTEGPSFDGVVIREDGVGALLSAPEESLPEAVQLVVKPLQQSREDNQAVRTAHQGYNIVALYDVTIVRDGEEVQPQGEVEIGMPIPPEYQNAVVVICRLGDDGTVTSFPTRRVGGMCYAVVDHFSRYAVAAPALEAMAQGGFPLAAALGGGAGLGLLLAVALIALNRGKQKKSE